VLLGDLRRSTELEYVASATKDHLVALMDGKNGFTVVPQARDEYGSFWLVMRPLLAPVL